MKKIVVPPERILIPAEYRLGNESILNAYFRIFDKNQGDILPPAIVVNSKYGGDHDCYGTQNSLDFYTQTSLAFINRGKFQEIMSVYENQADTYYLLDGNHRTAAATLTHKPINALELKSDADLVRIRKMVEKGELFSFDRNEDSLMELTRNYECHVCQSLEQFMTVQERLHTLTSNGDLPHYMTKRYRGTK